MPKLGTLGAVMAQWIRTLILEVPGSNLLAVSVMLLGMTPYPHCLVPRRGLNAIGALVDYSQAAFSISKIILI